MDCSRTAAGSHVATSRTFPLLRPFTFLLFPYFGLSRYLASVPAPDQLCLA
jgi:hypothetical protein